MQSAGWRNCLHAYLRSESRCVCRRLNGKQIGGIEGRTLNVKKAASAKEIIRKHSKDFGGNLSDAEVIILAGVTRNTYYKYKRELKEQ